jgi:HxlR-like helix-turn-helix
MAGLSSASTTPCPGMRKASATRSPWKRRVRASKRLERDALLVARPYSGRPPRAAYELTAEGKELAGALRLLAHGGARRADPAEIPRHAECGTPVEVHWYCPTCDRLIDGESPHPDLDLDYV